MSKMKKCPVCSQPIKLENLEKHIKKVHPRDKVEIDYSEKEEEKLKAYKSKQKELAKPAGAWKLVAVITTIIVLLGALIFITSNQGGNSNLEVGDPAPNFSLQDIDNNLITINGLLGEIVLLDFFDTDCSACQQQTQTALVPIYKNYSNKITMISVDVGFIYEPDTEADIIAFKNQYGAEWTYILDDGPATSLYHINSTPRDFIINREGKIENINIGRHSYEYIAAQIDALL